MISQSPVFLLNSCHPLVCAPTHGLRRAWASLSRSYGGKLPSSFNVILSSALVCSTCPPVSVSGTVYKQGLFPGTSSTPGQSSKAKRHKRSVTTCRLTNINVIPIDYAFRPRLRDRLTLRRLTLRRNPWTFGDTVFHSVCRYSCQHSHFRSLQEPSRVSLHKQTERSATVIGGQKTDDRRSDDSHDRAARTCSMPGGRLILVAPTPPGRFVDITKVERITRPHPHFIRRTDRHPDRSA